MIGALLLTQALAGTHLIAGQVSDRNGSPVARAIISLQPGNVELVTDREGRFLIDYLRDEEGERIKLAKKTDYKIEVFKPGFHTKQAAFYYKKGELSIPPMTLVEETIEVTDDPTNLDPGLHQETTHAAGANYEGQ